MIPWSTILLIAVIVLVALWCVYLIHRANVRKEEEFNRQHFNNVRQSRKWID
jgi:hypothetical protein